MAKFSILAVHKESQDRRVLVYDNETNVLQGDDGFVFEDASRKVSKMRVAKKFSKYDPIKKSKKVQILKIQLGLSCNYSCDYCSQRFVERAPETSKKDIDDFMRKLDNLEFVEKDGLKIEMWGGEPLVYWKTIKPLVAALKEKFKSWKTPPHFSMITNGSILTREISYWLVVNNFSVAISHDGPGQHVRGPDPFDDPEQKEIIFELYSALKRTRHNLSFNAMLNASNQSRKEIHQWFVDKVGDPDVMHGEGGMVDSYDDGGLANLLDTKAKHFAFRKLAFNDILENGSDIGFPGIIKKIDNFVVDILTHRLAAGMGQKCGMDGESTLAVDLRGNVLTCQNVSAAAVSHNGESHKAGSIEDMDAVSMTTATHWSNRPMCSDCPVLHLCKGSCMYIEGEHWTASCANAYSDSIALFALAIEKITGGYVPMFIEGSNLPDERADIFGEMMKHEEAPPKKKPFPVKIVAEKQSFEGVDVFVKSLVVEA